MNSTVRSLIATLLLLSPVLAAELAAEPKVGDEVRPRLDDAGEARILVMLSILPTDPRQVDLLRERTASARDAVLERLQADEFELTHRFETIPAFAGVVTAAGLDKLAAMAEVRRIDLDRGGSGNMNESLPLTRTDAVQALGLTGTGVTVAVLDSGIDLDHPDLEDSLEAEACFCFDNGAGCCPGGGTTQFGAGAASDDHGHGSNVTGIVTSNGTVAPLGSAPDAGIVSIKVLDNTNSFCCTSDVVAGLDWIIANRPDVDVVNMSLGTFATFVGDCDTATSFTQALAAAVDTLRANGVLSFVSSGNNALTNQMQAPACVASAIAVGAVWDSNVGSQSIFGCTDTTTAADKITCFSNRSLTTDLFGPGAPVTSCSRFGGVSTFFGTSQASPQLAGCAANVLQLFPGLDPTELETTMETTGANVVDPVTSVVYPRLDCAKFVDKLACRDVDMDGFRASDLCSLGGLADCDDGNPDRFPGNPEVCDGLDNDCDGTVPPGELGPPGHVADVAADSVQFSWPPEPASTSYDIVRGNLATLRAAGDFAAATSGCEADDTGSTSFAPPPAIPDGEFYLIRGGNCSGAGSYDSGEASQAGSRDAGVAASGNDCS